MTNQNDPAFSPETITQDYLDKFPELANLKRVAIGLTKREYFAIELMKPLVLNNLRVSETDFENNRSFVAKSALDLADALIAELNKTGGTQ